VKHFNPQLHADPLGARSKPGEALAELAVHSVASELVRRLTETVTKLIGDHAGIGTSLRPIP
jgi:hypothetical protein